MNRNVFLLTLVVVLLAIMAALGVAYYYIFPDIQPIVEEWAAALAFLPLEFILVVVVIDRLLASREKEAKLSKLNVVAGAFFSEAGNQLFKDFLDAVDDKDNVYHKIGINSDWKRKDFKRAMAFSTTAMGQVDISKLRLDELRDALRDKRPFFLVLLENPNLLEHERFTDMLISVFHLTEELEARNSLENLPEKDRQHLSVDINRAYGKLILEWLDYMQHIQSHYPFLYSLNLRIHPFQEAPSPVIQ
jgi:hypothetical protein